MTHTLLFIEQLHDLPRLPGGVQVDKKDLHSINVMQVSRISNHSAAASSGGRSIFAKASKRAAVSAAVSPGEPM